MPEVQGFRRKAASMTFEVIDGGKAQGQFICPYCAESFEVRSELSKHWLADARCRENRFVNNPMQSKYNIREDDDDQPSTE